jgi:hypothetical protein
MRPLRTMYQRLRLRRILWIVGSAAIVLVVGSRPAAASTNCPAAIPNDGNDDSAAIQNCLNGGGTIVLSANAGPYIVAQALQMTVAGSTLTSDGGCGAVIQADSSLNGYIPFDYNVDGVTIRNMWFDGNKGNRF